MLEVGELLRVLSRYGPWGLILIVAVYILLRGQIAFRYPRPSEKKIRRDQLNR